MFVEVQQSGKEKVR